VIVLAATVAGGVLLVGKQKPSQLKVQGTFTISNKSYDPTNDFADPNFRGDDIGGCQGASGYDDLNSITQVVVTNSQAQEIARTELGSGSEDGDGTQKSDTCTFTFNFAVRKGSPYYVVSVGDRGSSQYTFDELKTPGVVGLIIGNT
jgi:hypothetical protein